MKSGGVPKISCIVPAYRNAGDLCQTLSSLTKLFSQVDYASLEILVIDGSVEDPALTWMQDSFLPSNVSLVYINEPDLGPYDAMNKGISRANGEWLWFLNSGDLALGFCEENTLSTRHSIIIGSWYSSELNQTFYPRFETGLGHGRHHEIGHGLCHQSMLFKFELYSTRHYDYAVYHYAAELNFYVDALIQSDYAIDYRLRCLYNTSDGLSKRKAIRHWNDCANIYRKHRLKLSTYRRIYRYCAAFRLQMTTRVKSLYCKQRIRILRMHRWARFLLIRVLTLLGLCYRQ